MLCEGTGKIIGKGVTNVDGGFLVPDEMYIIYVYTYILYSRNEFRRSLILSFACSGRDPSMLRIPIPSAAYTATYPFVIRVDISSMHSHRGERNARD